MISLVTESKLGKAALGLGALGLAAHAGAEHFKDKEIAAHEMNKDIEEIRAKRAAKRLSRFGTGSMVGAGVLGAKAAMPKNDKKPDDRLNYTGI